MRPGGDSSSRVLIRMEVAAHRELERLAAANERERFELVRGRLAGLSALRCFVARDDGHDAFLN